MVEFAQPDEAPDLNIYREAMECASNYLGLPADHSGYRSYPFPQRLYPLSEILRAHVLREGGDIKGFIRLDKAMSAITMPDGNPARQRNGQDKTILAMMEWLGAEIDSIQITETSREKAVVTVMVWGEKYTQKCLDVLFKSFMGDGNLDVLCEWKHTTFHVQTTTSSKKIIENSPIALKMKEIGVNFVYAIIPDEIIDGINTESLYWMVGAGATLGLIYAKRNNAAFHLAFPDIVYSNNYFAELKRLSATHKAILANGPRADESILLPLLSAYTDEDKINIPSGDLVALGMNALHMSQIPAVVNNRTAMWMYPRNHFLIWESPITVHFNCPHLDAVWLSAEVVSTVKERFYMSLDSEMDLICKDQDFYIPQDKDKLFKIEMSEQSRHGVNDQHVNADGYGSFMWGALTHRDTLKFFGRGMMVAINRDLRPAEPRVFGEDQIGAEMAYLMNALMATDPYKGMQLARKRSHEGMIYRAA